MGSMIGMEIKVDGTDVFNVVSVGCPYCTLILARTISH